jgi:(4-alkanoyl-5-oxo-2,5-dihydrofuran-3-yl)methyl phosphate reductase
MKHLITGATGTVGSQVVEYLLSNGFRPAIFARDQHKAHQRFGNRVDLRLGDLANPDDLSAAFINIDTVFLVNSGPDLARRDQIAAKVALASGVKRIVKLSSADARFGVGTGAWHREGEAAIRNSGIPFVFIQPSGFMSNALHWAHSIKTTRTVRSATGEGKIPFIHPADIAAFAAKILTTPIYDGQSFAITGPAALSYREMTALFGEAIKTNLTLQNMTEEDVRREMTQEGEPAEVIEAHLSIYGSIREGRLADISPDFQAVMGRAPLTFQQWAHENAGAFFAQPQ